MPKPKIPIIILAAGESSRLGTPKQLLQWKDSNLLQHAIETAKSSISTEVYLVLGANFDLIHTNIDSKFIKIIHNKSWKNGLGNSISTGVKSIVSNNPELDGILVMLADQPLINSEYLNTMIAGFNSGGKQIVATGYNKGKKGVPVIFDACYLNELMELNDDEGAKHLIKLYSSYVKSIKCDIENTDIDTLKDYEKLYQANHL